MGRADARGFLMGCHEPLAGCWGSALDWRGLLWCRPGRAGGHFEMLQALRWIGWRGCDVVARWSPAARNVVGPGEMRCDELCTSADVGTLGERVERAYGDWRSAAVVGIVAWRCWGNDREKP